MSKIVPLLNPADEFTADEMDWCRKNVALVRVAVKGFANDAMPNEPMPQSVWIHHTGRRYRVLFLANEYDRADYPRTVVYQGIDNGKIWSGPLSDWHRRMTVEAVT